MLTHVGHIFLRSVAACLDILCCFPPGQVQEEEAISLFGGKLESVDVVGTSMSPKDEDIEQIKYQRFAWSVGSYVERVREFRKIKKSFRMCTKNLHPSKMNDIRE